MNDPAHSQPRCSFEAYEPYRPCTRRAFTECHQCGQPYCAEHVRLSAPGRYRCSACTTASSALQPSSAQAPVPPGQMRCPYCGGGQIYRPAGKGLTHVRQSPTAPDDLLGELFEAVLYAFWDEARGLNKTYAYACTTCNFHWNPEDLGGGDREEAAPGVG